MWEERKLAVIIVGSVLLGMLLASLVGCNQTPPPPPPASKVEKTEPPPPKGESKEEVAGEAKPQYQYDPTGRREPFKSLLAEELPPVVDLVVTPEPELELTQLQQFELRDLQLTGIILGGLGDYARVRAPDGKTYTLHVGTLVGKHEGKVIAIADNIVRVKETIRYQSGKVEDVESPMYLVPIGGGNP